MGEGQVSIDGTSYQLPKPFFVIATQNPIDQQGTFELPEAQRDRFSVKTAMGYPKEEGELELLQQREQRREKTPSVDPVTDSETLRRLQVTTEEVTVEKDVKEYMIQLARFTRTHSSVKTGVSPRGIQKMFETARAVAVINGRDFVIPQDVKTIAPPVYAHRLILTQEALVQEKDAEEIIQSAIGSVPVPGATGD
jgi:MoxR-like ATPase